MAKSKSFAEKCSEFSEYLAKNIPVAKAVVVKSVLNKDKTFEVTVFFKRNKRMFEFKTLAIQADMTAKHRKFAVNALNTIINKIINS